MLAELTGALAGLRSATEIVKGVYALDQAMAHAELKGKLADALTALADARVKLTEVDETIKGRDREISELKEALRVKAAVVRVYDAYYEIVDGEGSGSPFCSRCFEVDARLVHLTLFGYDGKGNVCPQCKSSYAARRTSPISAK